ncbi:MAG: hypothetical protein IT428_26335 [Planctomycetaceae bacterium]|nr:hypothetical protein [Planctomycetaceae bacterium]
MNRRSEEEIAEAERLCPGIAVSADQLREWIQEQQQFVRHALQTPHDTFTPHLVVMTKHDPSEPWGASVYALAVPFNEDHEKRVALERIGRDLYEHELIPGAATLSAEAWRSRTRGIEPRHASDRSEVIIVCGRTFLSQRTAWTVLPIARDTAGQIIAADFEPIIEGPGTPILDHLYSGFASAGLAAMQRKRARRPPQTN